MAALPIRLEETATKGVTDTGTLSSATDNGYTISVTEKDRATISVAEATSIRLWWRVLDQICVRFFRMFTETCPSIAAERSVTRSAI